MIASIGAAIAHAERVPPREIVAFARIESFAQGARDGTGRAPLVAMSVAHRPGQRGGASLDAAAHPISGVIALFDTTADEPVSAPSFRLTTLDAALSNHVPANDHDGRASAIEASSIDARAPQRAVTVAAFLALIVGFVLTALARARLGFRGVQRM